MPEVLCLFPFVTQTVLMGMEYDILFCDPSGDILLLRKIYNLREVAYRTNRLSLVQSTSQFKGSLLSHAIGNHVGRGITEDTGS